MKKNFKSLVLQSLVFMGLLFVLFLFVRLLFIAFFSKAVAGVNLNEFALFFYNAFRYDGQIIGVLSVLFFFLNLIPKEKIVRIYAFLVIVISAFVGIANIGFYGIYQDVFNASLLGLIYDDRKAIWQTALSGDYGFSYKVLLWLVLSVLFYALWAFLQSKIAQIQGKRFKASLFVVFALACLFSINGHIGLKGISLGKEIVPVTNTFLRQITQGAFRDLLYVYMSYAKIAKSTFADYTNESPLKATREFFALKDLNSSEFDLLKLLQKEVSNPSKVQIQHIFYIIAESLSEWHFDAEFKELGLMSELETLVNKKNAFKADIFLQNAGGTIKSLDVQISGLFQTEIPLNLSVGKNPVFKMSPGYIFKDLGYKTSFFYGGSGTWQKLDTYTKSQGFDEILFSNHIVSFAEQKGFSPPFENAWGAFDHYLYEFIKDYTLANKDTKSFAMIMTTSYHPPYDTPLKLFGIDDERVNAWLEKHPQTLQDERKKKIFAHIIYQDKMLARFVREMSQALPNSLFVITGDHYDREFPHAQIPTHIQNGVPLIIYAPNLKPKVLSNVGSHIDITPTIVELVAPNAYKYISFGEPLLSNDEKSLDKNAFIINKSFYENNVAKNRFALGFNAVANEDFIYDGHKIEYFKNAEFQSEKTKIQGESAEFKSQKAKIQAEKAEFKSQKAKIQSQSVNFQSKTANSNDESLAKAMFKQLKRARAISWWIINRGYIIKD